MARPKGFPRTRRFCVGRARCKSPDKFKDKQGFNTNDFDSVMDNKQLRDHLRIMQNENTQLKNEVAFLRAALKKNNGDAPCISGHLSSYSTKSAFESDSVHTAGFLLMVVWFTCVIFSHVPTQHLTKRLEFANHVPSVSSGSSNNSKSNNNSVETNTEFWEYTEEQQFNYEQVYQSESCDPIIDSSTVSIEPVTQRCIKKRKRNSITQNTPNKQARTSEKNSRTKKSASLTQHRTTEKSKEAQSATVKTETKTRNWSSGRSEKEDPKPTASTHQIFSPTITNWNPNTTYLICSSVSQITPPESESFSSSYHSSNDCPGGDTNVPLIAFFIPPDCIANQEASGINSSDSPPGQVLQVTCQVVGLEFIPVSQPQAILTS